MSYRHINYKGDAIDLPVGKVVCVGRNYLDHIRELNNPIPESSVLFLKPSTSICHAHETVIIPAGLGEVHNELEMSLLVKRPLTRLTQFNAAADVFGFGLGLDLTLRDVQTKLKAKGEPWERAKAFDYACPLTGFVELKGQNLDDIKFKLEVNQSLRQQGHTAHMMQSVAQLVIEISHCFTLMPGDVVMTGTPKGVGPLEARDQLKLTLDGYFELSTCIETME